MSDTSDSFSMATPEGRAAIASELARQRWGNKTLDERRAATAPARAARARRRAEQREVKAAVELLVESETSA